MVNLNISDHPRHEKFRQEKSRYLAENHAYFYDVNNFIFRLRKGESPARYALKWIYLQVKVYKEDVPLKHLIQAK